MNHAPGTLLARHGCVGPCARSVRITYDHLALRDGWVGAGHAFPLPSPTWPPLGVRGTKGLRDRSLTRVINTPHATTLLARSWHAMAAFTHLGHRLACVAQKDLETDR